MASLTDTFIRSIEPPEKGQKTYYDDLKGFGLRVSPGGTKTFVVVYGANRRRETIGRYPTVKLAKARAKAKVLLAGYTLGKHRPAAANFEEARRRFIEASETKNRPKTTREYERLLDRHFRLSRMQLEDVTREEIMRRVNKLKGTPSEQHHAFVAIKVFLNWCVKNAYLAQNPIAYVSAPTRQASRDHVLTDEELGRVYRHALDYPYPFGPIVALCILTGQRRSEIGGLRWEWIDGDTLTLPSEHTKNKHAHTIPLGEQAQEVIGDLPQLGDYLFPATRTHVRGKPTTSFNAWATAKPAFDKGLDVEPYTLHDLRRTFASTLAALGTPIHITEKLLNHVSGTISGVAAIYNRHQYIDEMREAIGRFEGHLEATPEG